MARLTFSLLGTFQATLDGEPITGFESDKVRALLAYLVVEANPPHRREKLASLFWPERPDREARANLRYALSNLRKVVGDRQAAIPVLCATPQTIQLNPEAEVWMDVAVFQELVSKYSAAPDQNQLHNLRAAVDLYKGEFLEGFSLADSPDFSEWLLIKREQLNRQLLTALRHLSSIYEQLGDYGNALSFAWQQVDLEPWQEEAHRHVMRLLALNGQRSAALAQYEVCRQALAGELDVEPTQETTKLYQQIRDEEWQEGYLTQAESHYQTAGQHKKIPPQRPESASSPAPAGDSSGKRFPSSLQILVVGGLLLLGVTLIFIFRAGFMPDVPPATPDQSPISAGLHPSDARVVAACEDDPPNKLCINDPRTGSITQIIDTPEFGHIHSASWSPDGERIAFSAALPGSSEYQVYLISPDGSNLEQLTSNPSVDLTPAWSPDGKEIAFIRAGELWSTHLAGGEATRWWGNIEETNVVGIGWSPDSKQIALANLYQQPQSSGMEIWIVDRGGADPQIVSTVEGSFIFALIAWSPDSQLLVCYCIHPDLEQGLLFKVDGSGEAQTLPQNEIPIAWFHSYWPQWGDSN